MIEVTFSALLWLSLALRSYLLILSWYFQVLVIISPCQLLLLLHVCLKKCNNYTWFYEFYVNFYYLLFFYKRYSGTFCDGIIDHLQLQGDLFKVSGRLMLFFLCNNFSVIKDFSYGDIEYITNIATLIIWQLLLNKKN